MKETSAMHFWLRPKYDEIIAEGITSALSLKNSFCGHIRRVYPLKTMYGFVVAKLEKILFSYTRHMPR